MSSKQAVEAVKQLHGEGYTYMPLNDISEADFVLMRKIIDSHFKGYELMEEMVDVMEKFSVRWLTDKVLKDTIEKADTLLAKYKEATK